MACVPLLTCYNNEGETPSALFAPASGGGGGGSVGPNIVASTILLGPITAINGAQMTVTAGTGSTGAASYVIRDPTQNYNLLQMSAGLNVASSKYDAYISQGVSQSLSGNLNINDFTTLNAPLVNLNISSINGGPIFPANPVVDTLSVVLQTQVPAILCRSAVPGYNVGLVCNDPSASFEILSVQAGRNPNTLLNDATIGCQQNATNSGILNITNFTTLNAPLTNLQISSINGAAPALATSDVTNAAGTISVASGFSDSTVSLPAPPSGKTWYVTATPTSLIVPSVCWYSVTSTASSFTLTLNDAQPADVGFNYTAIAY